MNPSMLTLPEVRKWKKYNFHKLAYWSGMLFIAVIERLVNPNSVKN